MLKAYLLVGMIIGCAACSPPAQNGNLDPAPKLTEQKTESVKKDKLLQGLNSSDESERSQAAIAMFENGNPMAVQALVQTIGDAADMLHLDYSPSVHALIEVGAPALLPVIDLLDAPEEFTRLRAQRVVEGISLKRLTDEEEWRNWWRGIAYNYEDSATWADGKERLIVWTESL